MRIKSALVIVCFAAQSLWACENQGQAKQSMAQQLYEIPQARDYVCGQNEDCSLKDFEGKLTFTPVRIRSADALNDAMRVEPANKGIVAFAALFLCSTDEPVLIFSPDFSSTDLKILPTSHHGMFDVRTTDRDSRSEWSETTYVFDAARKAYAERGTSCFSSTGGGVQKVACQ